MKRKFIYWWIRNVYPRFRASKIIRIHFGDTVHFEPGELIMASGDKTYKCVGNDWFLIQ